MEATSEVHCWTCESCQRRIPNYVGVCRCGVMRSSGSLDGDRVTHPISKTYVVLVFAIATLLLLAGLWPARNGQVIPGYLISSVLYLAFGFALAQNHRLARARFWWLAALPIALAPLGLIILIATTVLVGAIRRGGRKQPLPLVLSAPASDVGQAAARAGFLRRGAAYLIDGILIRMAAAAIWFPPFLAVGFDLGSVHVSPLRLRAMETAFCIVAGWIYFSFAESSRWQATLGKYLVGLRVESFPFRSQVSFSSATARYFAKFLSALPMGYGFLMAVSKEKKALHDQVTNTAVVTDGTGSKHGLLPWFVGATLVISSVVLDNYLYGEKNGQAVRRTRPTLAQLYGEPSPGASLAAFAEKMRPSLPMTLDDRTTLARVAGSANVLTFALTLTPSATGTDEADRLRVPAIRKTAVSGACSATEGRDLLRRGVTFQYLYYNAQDEALGSFEIRDADCIAAGVR